MNALPVPLLRQVFKMAFSSRRYAHFQKIRSPSCASVLGPVSGVGLGNILKAFWDALGTTLAPRGRLWETLGSPRGHQGGPRGLFCAMLGTIGHLWCRLLAFRQAFWCCSTSPVPVRVRCGPLGGHLGSFVHAVLYRWFRWFCTGGFAKVGLCKWFRTDGFVQVVLYRWFRTGSFVFVQVVLHRWFCNDGFVQVVLRRVFCTSVLHR